MSWNLFFLFKLIVGYFLPKIAIIAKTVNLDKHTKIISIYFAVLLPLCTPISSNILRIIWNWRIHFRFNIECYLLKVVVWGQLFTLQGCTVLLQMCFSVRLMYFILIYVIQVYHSKFLTESNFYRINGKYTRTHKTYSIHYSL